MSKSLLKVKLYSNIWLYKYLNVDITMFHKLYQKLCIFVLKLSIKIGTKKPYTLW